MNKVAECSKSFSRNQRKKGSSRQDTWAILLDTAEGFFLDKRNDLPLSFLVEYDKLEFVLI